MDRKRRTPGHLIRRAIAQIVLIVLSVGYLITAAMLMFFGYIVGWEIDPGRPVIGIAMILAGIAVFTLGPRTIKRITGRDPIDPPAVP